MFKPSSATKGLPWWLSGKASCCNAANPGSIAESGKYLGGGNGNPLWYSCLENPMDKGAGQATVHRVTVRHDQNNLTRTQDLFNAAEETLSSTLCFELMTDNPKPNIFFLQSINASP